MNNLRNLFTILFILIFYAIQAQINNQHVANNYSFIGLGYSVGRTLPANFYFPETERQQNLNITIGKSNYREDINWLKHLNYPKTGFIISYTDYGNPSQVGRSIALMPFIDFNIFNRSTNKISLQTGFGAAYFNVLYNKETNPTNLGISTHVNWTYRTFLNYKFLEKKTYNMKIGVGYQHNSNGHLRLPNSGLNSFLMAVNSEFYFNKKETTFSDQIQTASPKKSESRSYYSTRLGFGQNVLSKFDISKKDVATFALSYGKIKSNTYKYGGGIYYRYYESYYDYIKNNGTIVNEKYPEFKKSPLLYSSNVGLFTNFEFLMNHISIEAEIGVNLYKPSYKIDWQINNEKTVNGVYIPAKFGFLYSVKSIVSSRLGMKYYVINNNKSPIHNLFIGATVNANLGQADFSELSLGYVYSPIKK
jgi:hypothetical protein